MAEDGAQRDSRGLNGREI